MSFKLLEKIATLSENKIYTKEINLVAWNQNSEKYDIRLWRKDNNHPSRGITFTLCELKELKSILDQLELD